MRPITGKYAPVLSFSLFLLFLNSFYCQIKAQTYHGNEPGYQDTSSIKGTDSTKSTAGLIILDNTGDTTGAQAMSGGRGIGVVDETEPFIRLLGDSAVYVCRWATYNDPGYEVSDNYWANDDIKVVAEGDFSSTDVPGTYKLRYKATDKSDNTGYSLYRKIIVLSEIESLCMSGLHDQDPDSYLKVYPNPSNGEFNMAITLAPSEKFQVKILNSMGQEIEAGNFSYNNNLYTIDLSPQPPGVYILMLRGKTINATRQIIIKR